MKKFRKSLEELDNILEKWVYLLGNLKRLDGRPKVLQDRVFESFFRAAEIAKLPPGQQQNYRRSLMNENDWHNAINHAEYNGELKGIEKGREEERLKNARNLKALGVAVEIIVKATGLSEDEVLSL